MKLLSQAQSCISISVDITTWSCVIKHWARWKSEPIHFGAPILTHNTALPASLASLCTSQTTEEDLFHPINTLTVNNSPENTNYQYKNMYHNIFFSTISLFWCSMSRGGLCMRCPVFRETFCTTAAIKPRSQCAKRLFEPHWLNRSEKPLGCRAAGVSKTRGSATHSHVV